MWLTLVCKPRTLVHSSSLNASFSAVMVWQGQDWKHSLQHPRSLSGMCIAVISLIAYRRLTLRSMSLSMISCSPFVIPGPLLTAIFNPYLDSLLAVKAYVAYHRYEMGRNLWRVAGVS